MDAELLRIKQQVQQDMHAWASTPRDEDVVADCDPSRAQKMPFVTLTYAQSIDGSIAAERGTPTLLSGALSMKMTHMLRTVHDGIVVGVGTILADNPSLNARFAEGACVRRRQTVPFLQNPTIARSRAETLTANLVSFRARCSIYMSTRKESNARDR